MLTFLEELRRRNVGRVGAAYLVVAWVIAQVGELVLDALDAPTWLLKALLATLALGFPVALVLAWLFDLTPDGVVRTARNGIDDQDCETARDPRLDRRRLDLVILGALSVALAFFASGWYARPDSGTASTHTELAIADIDSRQPSIAVLPFLNLSSDQEQAWFADGLTEEILNALARTPDLRVAARTSSFAYRNSELDIRTIAHNLGVLYVLEGSVRRSRDRLRVTAQLVRARDGFHVWSENYDNPLEDVIDIQESVAENIVSAFHTATNPDALTAMVSAGTRSVPAFESYLRGLAHQAASFELGSAARSLEARDAYQRAVTLDPGFAKAWWRLAVFWQVQLNVAGVYSDLTALPRDEIRARYTEAINRAIRTETDPLSRIRYQVESAFVDLDYVEALGLSSTLLEQRPLDPDAQQQRLLLLTIVGDYEAAAQAAIDYQSRDGYDPEVAIVSITALLNSGNAERLREFIDTAMQRLGDNTTLVYQAHRGLLWAGDLEAAARLLSRIRASSLPEFTKHLAMLRQACADRRLEEATAIYRDALVASADRIFSAWLAHRVMGEDAAAHELIRTLDSEPDLSRLAALLNYGFFDPRPYPRLHAHLERQGIDRGEPTAIPYRCIR